VSYRFMGLLKKKLKLAENKRILQYRYCEYMGKQNKSSWGGGAKYHSHSSADTNLNLRAHSVVLVSAAAVLAH
jgi:hypothetical protein